MMILFLSKYHLYFLQFNKHFFKIIYNLYFFKVRCLWWILGTFNSEACEIAKHLTDRIIICLFLFIWNCVLLYWMDIVHSTKNTLSAKHAINGDIAFKPQNKAVKILFYVVTGLIIVVTLILAIFGVIYYRGIPNVDLYYGINMILICLMHFIYMIGILIYGTVLSYRLYKNGRSRLGFIFRIEMFALIILICFSVRIVAFILYVLYNNKINMIFVFIFGNLIPEVIPTLLCVWFFNSKFIKQKYLEIDDPNQGLLND